LARFFSNCDTTGGLAQQQLAPELCYSFVPAVDGMMMEISPKPASASNPPAPFYCPDCAAAVSDPLTCGDCSAVICRRCGTPLESSDELGMG